MGAGQLAVDRPQGLARIDDAAQMSWEATERRDTITKPLEETEGLLSFFIVSARVADCSTFS